MKFFVQLILLLVAGFAVASDYVEFTIVGRIRFSVPAGWTVIVNKSSAEKTIFGFQIPNSADAETSDSSNLSIRSSYLKEAEDRNAFDKKPPSTDLKAREQAVRRRLAVRQVFR